MPLQVRGLIWVFAFRRWVECSDDAASDRRALELIHSSASTGLVPAAISTLATCYLLGWAGLEKSVRIATRLYKEAAKLGHVTSMVKLAEAQYFGRGGIVENEAKSVVWLEKAVSAGSSTAHALLGKMYLNGEGGLPVDFSRAVHLLTIASLSDGAACFRLAECYEFGSPDGRISQQLPKAQELLRRGAKMMRKNKPRDNLAFVVATPPASQTTTTEMSSSSREDSSVEMSIRESARSKQLRERRKRRATAIISPQVKEPHPSDRRKPRRLPIPPLPTGKPPPRPTGWESMEAPKWQGPLGPVPAGFGMKPSHCPVIASGRRVIPSRSSVYPFGAQTEY